MRCRLKNRAPWLDLPASGCRLKNGAPATVLRRAGHAPPSANRCKPHVRPSTREVLPQSSAQSSHLVRVQSLVPAPGCCTRNALPATTCGHALPSSPFTHLIVPLGGRFFFPCIFRVAIGNSESQIEKRQVEKCKVLPLQEQQEETPQGKMQRFKSAKNTRHVK